MHSRVSHMRSLSVMGDLGAVGEEVVGSSVQNWALFRSV